MNDDQ